MQLNTNILIHAIPAFILLIFVEYIFILKEHGSFRNRKEISGNVFLGISYLMLVPITKSFYLLFCTFLYERRLFDVSGSGLLMVWVICFIGDDFTYYWAHRLCHEVRYLWASHSVHHSAEHLSLSAAFRQSWTTNLTGIFILWAWLPLIGISPAIILFVKSIDSIYQFWLHTETIKKMPRWIEFIFNTPSHHRVHHASDIEYLDKNHGGMLIIWDRLFGTYKDEGHLPHYGLTKNIKSNNPFTINFYEWTMLMKDIKKSTSIADCLCYIFKAPGWDKNGSSRTSRMLQKNQPDPAKLTAY